MYHLAQLNIGKLRYPIDHPEVAEFADNLDKINALAEGSKGFVWRLKDESGNATGIKAFDDPMIIVNMSVWDTLENLKAFVYKSGHIDFLKKRNLWFENPASAHMVLWWIKKGYIPTVQEARLRLKELDNIGESPAAFTFKKTFVPPEK
ncbi:DUF3291 domain-containing protein [Fulvivirgaceae bacterium BMA12]|uniref:DUF3291 domain-containing protein n=1 Tax=Agaribacillus aureus TaxID=3051825 RepID=A0ABT8L4P2_9BACT|nr:DUF3291 domain-containing protein [Fulvivirgaceae bacterium BMA12]